MKKGKMIIPTFIVSSLLLTGCTSQYVTKNLGGSMTVYLEPNTVLEEITWKDDSLWYLTRSMREDEIPQSHSFRESDSLGLLEGQVIVIESKLTDNEKQEYEKWKTLNHGQGYSEYIKEKELGINVP